MTRCPVPYALVALLGWGLLDVVRVAVAARVAALRRLLARHARVTPGIR